MRLADPISSRHVAILNVFRHIVVECGAGRAMLQVRSSNNQTSVAVVQKYDRQSWFDDLRSVAVLAPWFTGHLPERRHIHDGARSGHARRKTPT